MEQHHFSFNSYQCKKIVFFEKLTDSNNKFKKDETNKNKQLKYKDINPN